MATTVNALMKHLRDSGVAINGSKQKSELRLIGYYHGYKGYRFSGRASNRLPLSDFSEVVGLYKFDMELKALLYSRLMLVETALKNRVLEAVFEHCRSERFEDIFKKCLTAHRYCSRKVRRKAWKQRLQLKAEVDRLIASNHGSRDVITHFHDRDRDVPVWALFEVMTLGNFGVFFQCLGDDVKDTVCESLGMPTRKFNAPLVLTKMIFALKDLRNAVAHNGVTIDVRFKRAAVDGSIGSLLRSEMGSAQAIRFDEIADYVLLLVYLMGRLGCPKSDCKCLLSDFEKIVERYRLLLPHPIFSQYVSTGARGKLGEGKSFVKGL